MHRVRAGDRVVVGYDGVRVHAPERARDVRNFEFMNSDVSSEKPKALLIEQVADRIRSAKERGGKLLAVCGPAVVHTGGAPDVARLVREGWIDVLFAGNGFATHDIESNVLGTSLGVSVAEGTPVEHGHCNHLRVINEMRRHGSIAAAVEAGFVTGGVMYECVRRQVPFVLGGSVRDDGPLPDTIADVVDAADAMREHVPGVAVALMLASTLHAIATGNILPAGVETFCVDINQAVVTKLADRGSHQALGIVTDVGPFLHQLADTLCCVARTLDWGRRYLMCPPEHFGVLYEINPWMHREVSVDRDVSRSQWDALVANLRAAGAEVVTIEPQPDVPDLVFTANAGVVSGDVFVPSHFRYPERQPETEVFASWFGEHGWTVERLPADLGHEGAGDALPFDGTLLCGYRIALRRVSRHRAVTHARRTGAHGRAGRRAAVPRRPHLLSARRPTCARARRRMGPLRAHGRGSTRARTALARGRRGPVLLCELGRRRHEHRDACRAGSRRPPARGVGLQRGGVTGRRVPEGRWRLPVPDAGAGRHARPRRPTRLRQRREPCGPP